MTQTAREVSEVWVSSAAQAERSLVHVSAPCRRGASGAVYDAQGLVVTTARAVAGQDEVEVVQGESTATGRVVGFDAATDIGLVRLEAPLGSAPTWATEPARLGQALLGGSRPGRAARVRWGLVSQLGGAWHTLRGGRMDRYVELDLAIEPGFSGGLAFDAEGRALGQLSAGLLRGVPLLLEPSTLERVVQALVAHGQVRRGYLGVGTQAVRLPTGQAQPSGLLVVSVQGGSAAERAGLLIGDVLLTLGGVALTEPSALQATLEDAAERPLALTLLRGGQPEQVEITAGVRP